MEALAPSRLILPVVVATALIAAPSAAAATATATLGSTIRSDGTTVVRYAAGKGEDNELTLRVRAEAIDPYRRQLGLFDDTGLDFYDLGADRIDTSGPFCHAEGTGAGCDVLGKKVEVQVDLGDGDDFVLPKYDAARLTPVHVNAGPGNDALQVRGTTPSAIDFHGGTGIDAVDYFDPSGKPYAFSDDGRANDGLGHDNIGRDVELYIAGDGNDTFDFTGRERHIVFGTGGDDTLFSGPGADEFDGGYGGDPAGTDGPSNDTVSYAGRSRGVRVTLDGAADDGAPGEGDYILPTVEQVIGTNHPDTIVGPARAPDSRPYRLTGNGGNDVLSGGGGQDLVDAGAGDDVVMVRGGGKDAVRCGPGHDTLIADSSDLSRDCEHVSHSYVRVASKQQGKAVAATVAVPVPGSKVTARLMAGKRTLAGSRTAKLGAGLRPLTIFLNHAARHRLSSARSLPLTVRVKIAPPGRSSVSGSKRVTLSAGG